MSAPLYTFSIKDAPELTFENFSIFWKFNVPVYVLNEAYLDLTFEKIKKLSDFEILKRPQYIYPFSLYIYVPSLTHTLCTCTLWSYLRDEFLIFLCLRALISVSLYSSPPHTHKHTHTSHQYRHAPYPHGYLPGTHPPHPPARPRPPPHLPYSHVSPHFRNSAARGPATEIGIAHELGWDSLAKWFGV
jgi:hypothetical protein